MKTAGILVALLVAAPATAGPFEGALRDDLSRGLIDQDEASVYRLLAFTRPDLLPGSLRWTVEQELEQTADDEIRCGTPYVLPVLQRWHALHADLRSLASVAMYGDEEDDRGPGGSVQCNGTAPNEAESDHFVVKYGNSYDGAGVEDLLEAVEAHRATLVEELGYQEPWGIEQGLKLPVFIGNSGSGMPTISWQGGYASICPDRQGAYFVLSPNISDWTFTGDVAPHELYHTVQFSYDVWLDDWWWEATAVWSEDLTYTDINAYAWFIEYYTDAPETSIEEAGTYRMYGMFIFPMYLEEFEADGIHAMREIWEQATTGSIPDAMDVVLSDHHDTTFDDAFAGFSGRAAVMEDFEDGSLFGEPIRVAKVTSYPEDSSSATDAPPQRYGTNYIELHADDAEPPDTKLRFEFDGGGESSWILGVTQHRIEDGLNRVSHPELGDDGNATVEIIDFGTLYDEVVIGVTWSGQSLQSTGYSWTADIVEQTEPQGDDDDDDDVVIDDDDDSLDGGGSGCSAYSPYRYQAEAGPGGETCSTAAARPSAWTTLVGLAALFAYRRF